MGTLVILQQMCVIAILVAMGILLYKKNVIDDNASKKLSALTVDVCNPALIMASVLTGNITVSRQTLLRGLLLAFVVYLCLIALGFVFPYILRSPKEDRRFYNLMTIYSNIGFIGIPLARAILPDNSMIYIIIGNVVYCLLFYTHGIAVLSGGREKIDLRKLLSPGTVMAVLTLIVFWFNLQLPRILSDAITYVGSSTTFMSMTLLGVAIARSDIREGLKDLRVYGYILLRMILLPIALGLLLSQFLPDSDMILAFVLMAAMPVGNLPLILAGKLGEDTTVLSRYIMVTTVVSLVTVTLVLSVVQMFIL